MRPYFPTCFSRERTYWISGCESLIVVAATASGVSSRRATRGETWDVGIDWIWRTKWRWVRREWRRAASSAEFGSGGGKAERLQRCRRVVGVISSVMLGPDCKWEVVDGVVVAEAVGG